MNIPNIENPEKYIGLYIVDFGEYCSVGFNADEVAEILESKKLSDVKVYKIHRADPSGNMEIKGVSRELFELEAGLFFYSSSRDQAEDDYKNLVNIAVTSMPPSRAKVHLSKIDDNTYVTCLIYPAEADAEFSQWLLDNNYQTSGAAKGGISAVSEYYDMNADIIERHQLFPAKSIGTKTGDELLNSLKLAVQR